MQTSIPIVVKEIKTLCVLNLPVSIMCVLYPQRERIMKTAQVTIRLASSEVVSFGQHPVIHEMENPLLEWTDECIKRDILLCYTSEEISIFNK